MLEPALRVHGGQRQPGRAPHRAPAGVPRTLDRAGHTTDGSGARSTRALTLADERLEIHAPAHPAAEYLQSRAGGAGEGAARRRRRARACRGWPSRSSGPRPRWWEPRLAADRAEPAIEWITWSLRLDREPRGELHRGGIDRVRRPCAQLAASSPAAAELIAAAPGHRRPGLRLRHGDGLPLPVRRRAEAVRHRLPERTHSLDGSYYDLLASEARLASFMAVAKNDVPVDHWFRLGRTLTYAAGEPALVSWSGSMFEYLMPLLVMRSFPFTVLSQTYEGALARQIAYGKERDVPWGVSESAYNVRDRHQTYQYRPFGVPDLALKRGLGRELVVAPYASVLAAMVDPERVARQPARAGDEGRAGPLRLPRRDRLHPARCRRAIRHVVGAYMAHHLGMGMVALTNAADRRRYGSARFHADPLVRSAELLLHERIPRRLVLQKPQGAQLDEAMPEAETERPSVRQLDTPDTPAPARRPAGPPALHHHGEPLRRRVQPLRGPRRDALALGRHPRSHRTVLLREGLCRPAGSGRRRTSRCARRPTGTTPSSPPTGSPSTAPTATSRPAPRSRSSRRTRPRCGG